ncbi:MAG: hypothetical protein Q9M92_01745 [Enterobacterales bacterium]|nr:hypothetical protein [Enterobacterales bacterium]
MSNVDKTTVRNEVSRIKADFEQLCASGKITTEIKFPDEQYVYDHGTHAFHIS